jgi:hypothetical protein
VIWEEVKKKMEVDWLTDQFYGFGAIDAEFSHGA